MSLNSKVLLADERSEGLQLLSLSAPAIALVCFIIVIPTGALFLASFVTSSGFTFEHYTRIFTSELYFSVFSTTLFLSVLVTMLAVLLGYPLAYVLSRLPASLVPICLALVLVPFWTSIIVRTYAWLVLLQRTGVINRTLLQWGLIEEPLRLAFNLTGTVIGMLHIMLPFLVLPLFASMKLVNTDYIRAAISLGATPTRAFWTVFFPLTVPGLSAGALLVFIYCLGFYITPQILGGGRVITVSMQVYDNATMYSDWGAASALGLTMLAAVFGILLLWNRATRGLSREVS